MRQQTSHHARPGHAVQPDTKALVAMFQAGRHADVETHARRLLTKYPQSGFLWKALGAAQQIQGKDALHALKQSCTLLHGDAESHNILGVALHAAGQSGAALNSLDNALRLKPDYADACSNRGMMLFDLARYQEATASLERALALNPLHVQACNNLGNVYLKLKLAGRAAECYRRAIALVPQYAEAHNNLGNAFYALGNLEEAAASYRQAVRHRPDYAEALSNLASVQQELGLLDKAQDNCRRALTLDPHCAKAHANLARVLQERVAEAAVIRFAVRMMSGLRGSHERNPCEENNGIHAQQGSHGHRRSMKVVLKNSRIQQIRRRIDRSGS